MTCLSRTVRSLSFVCVAALSVGSIATAQVPPSAPSTLPPVAIDAPIVTTHSGIFNGRRIGYDAIVEAFVTNDLSDKPAVRLVTTSYIARNGGGHRPVLFVFNGGPIVATTPLHLGLFGPKRLRVPDDLSADPATFPLVDNVYSPLDIADVVIFDPASTGYSRVIEGVAPESQFSTVADARQLAQLVLLWTKRHGREDAPVYLVGESYGTLRAPAAASQLQQAGKQVDGLILLGQALNIVEYAQRRDNIISYAVSLPTLAAIGWTHGKVDHTGRTFEQLIKEAADFGGGEYLSVLFQGNRATPERRAAVAQRLQELTGLPATNFLKADLKVSKTQYQRELIPGYVLDTYDARYKRPVGVTVDNGPRYSAAAIGYFHDFLRVPVAAGIYSTGLAGQTSAAGWDWDEQKTPFGDWPWVGQVRSLMTANPKFRVLLGNGYQDTQTTIGAMDYLAAQSGWPRDHVRTRYYVGGHMMYTVEASARQVADDVRDMVSGK